MNQSFTVYIKRNGKPLCLGVSIINVNKRTEQYLIESHGHSVTFESNRPLWRNRGVKHHRPTVKVVQGSIRSSHDLEEITSAILLVLEPPKMKLKKKEFINSSAQLSNDKSRSKGTNISLGERTKI